MSFLTSLLTYFAWTSKGEKRKLGSKEKKANHYDANTDTNWMTANSQFDLKESP